MQPLCVVVELLVVRTEHQADLTREREPAVIERAFNLYLDLIIYAAEGPISKKGQAHEGHVNRIEPKR